MHVDFSIPEGHFEGYIFDCDGTLADTMPLHYQAWRKTLDENGGQDLFPLEQFYSMGGVAPVDILAALNRDHQLTLDIHKIAADKEVAFMHSLETVDPIENVVQFARDAAKNHPVSVVSGGLKPVVIRTLEILELADLFHSVITPQDAERGKPHPDMFLLAAEKMSVAPGKCLVFEDGPSGMDGARAAGMEVVYIASHPDELSE
ncbi:MAG: HAD family phosphatase [Verrucomicrobiota bacterium]